MKESGNETKLPPTTKDLIVLLLMYALTNLLKMLLEYLRHKNDRNIPHLATSEDDAS